MVAELLEYQLKLVGQLLGTRGQNLMTLSFKVVYWLQSCWNTSCSSGILVGQLLGNQLLKWYTSRTASLSSNLNVLSSQLLGTSCSMLKWFTSRTAYL